MLSLSCLEEKWKTWFENHITLVGSGNDLYLETRRCWGYVLPS